ncbi:MAG TPA: L-histidine N(alpha)-methyltransferase [Solirubrobacterales bacterium]|nr:L-histidine N(alpha)-methyltransferase [Solirubrobacterales bacterium]
MANQSERAEAPPKSTVADGISGIARELKRLDAPLGFGVWDLQTADRRGEAMNALKGTGGQPKHLKDGYQYVGGFPSHRWRVATTDEHYRTLNYGISQFPRTWHPVRDALDQAYHYVSIGPGTGEKDRIVLRHLQSMASDETVVYVPIDISGDLLRIGLDTALRDIDDDRVEVLPIELDITDAEALQGLKIIIHELTGDSPVLYSLLGNTLANFSDDRRMLNQITELLASPQDRLFLELATTREANPKLAEQAASEYEGSRTFRDFATAALHEYTDLPSGFGTVHPTAEIIDDDQVLRITTHLIADKTLQVSVKDGDDFKLSKGELIELYISRKYTPDALDQLCAGLSRVASGRQGFRKGGFGIAMELLSVAGVGNTKKALHPVAGSGAEG